jgi:tRNA-specific 2-thiouridylase
MNKPSVLLAMSGGTDSTVAASLLIKEGYHVIGLTIRMYDHFEAPGKDPDFIAEAKDLARQLGIAHSVIDARKSFGSLVVNYFIDEHFSGRTPFPCRICNPEVKFKILFEEAIRLGIDYVATGHYVRKEWHDRRVYLADAVDQKKNQSFFLWNLQPLWLQRLLFPLGDLFKQEVPKLASHFGLKSVSDKKDSMGICFLPHGDHHSLLDAVAHKHGLSDLQGAFVDRNGSIIGTHRGFFHYTIGQRRGLNHKQNMALFVTALCPERNLVQLGEYHELERNRIELVGVNFYYPDDLQIGRIFILKIRYRNQATPCRIEKVSGPSVSLRLLEPLHAVAPGQSAVFFDDKRVLGGGVIKNSLNESTQ